MVEGSRVKQNEVEPLKSNVKETCGGRQKSRVERYVGMVEGIN